MHSQFAIAVRTVNENCCMHMIHVSLWLGVCGVWNYVSVYVWFYFETY